jgi:hypothetical protein
MDEVPERIATDLDTTAGEWSWCEIEWVRSFRGSQFEARPLTPAAAADLPRSPLFRWREDRPPPETNADAREAHEALLQALVEAGWEPVADTGPWYGERFRLAAAGDEPEVSYERARVRWGAKRIGIAALTLGSLAVIVFALLVLLGSFR